MSEIEYLRDRVSELEETLRFLYNEVLVYQSEEPISVLSLDDEERVVRMLDGD